MRTSVLAEARLRGAWLEVQIAEINSAIQSLAEAPTPGDLRGIYQHAFKNALDAYLVEQMAQPWLEDRAIRRNGDRARYYTMAAASPTLPAPGPALERELLQQNVDQDTVERMQQLAAELQRDPRINAEALAAQLIAAGVQANPTNVEYALRVVAVASRQACIEATTLLGAPDPTSELPPVPRSIAAVLGPMPSIANSPNHLMRLVAQPDPKPAEHPLPPQPVVSSPAPAATPDNGTIDCTISELAQHALKERTQRGEWSDTCRGDVRGAINLFIAAAGGDVKLSEVRQQHITVMSNIMSRLPPVYGKKKKGCTSDELQYETIEEALERGDELARLWAADPIEAGKQKLRKPGLSPATRNKHAQWLASVFAFGAEHGFFNVNVNVKGLKMRDHRAPNLKRRAWSLGEMGTLLSGPIWEGSADIFNRLRPGDLIIHDAAYFAPLILVAHAVRSQEACGLMLDDVMDTAEVPHIIYRHNAYRRLKTVSSERHLPIPNGLIELGFLDYVRALREEKQDLVFPELWSPQAKAFDKAFRDKVFRPLLEYHFPDGTSRRTGNKDVDVHSIRAAGLSRLDELRFRSEDTARFAGHLPVGTTAKIYLEPVPAAHFVPLVDALWQLVPQIKPAPLRLRPSELLKFGSPRGRRKLAS